MRRCRHRWRELCRIHVPPVAGLTDIKGTAELVRDVVYGYTIVSLRCSGCGDVAERKLTGECRSVAP
jgi:hypothetical protein